MNPIHQKLSEQGGLADRLRAMRAQAALTGKELAETAGWQISKVSKLENGKQMPTGDDIEAWTRACGNPEAAAELNAMLDDLQAWHRDWKSRLKSGGHAAVQADFVTLVRETRVVRDFELVTVPGMLQTPDYMRAVFNQMAELHGTVGEDIEAAVAQRLQRQQFLYDADKRFEFLIDESILHRPVHGISITVAQIDRFHSVIGMSNVRFGVLPLWRPLATTPQNRFALFDDVAFVETFVGETRHEGNEAAQYHQAMDRLWRDAVEGEEARPLLTQAATKLKTL